MRCRSRLEGHGVIASKEARLELADGVPALGKRQIRIAGETPLDLTLVKLLIVKGAELPRQPAERPDEPELRGDQVDDQAKPHLPRKREAIVEFALCLDERIARRQHIRVQLLVAVGRVGQIADPVCSLERTPQEIAATLDVSRPRDDEAAEDQAGSGLEA